MKIAICGLGRAGKDTAAEYLRDEFGLRYTHGTSRWAAMIVWVEMTKRNINYDTVQECFEDRHNHRELWAKIIGRHNAADPCRMYRECLEHQDILVGLRWRSEFLACKAAKLWDVSLYVTRPGCIDPTCEVLPGDCDYVIRNDGTLAQFHAKLSHWASTVLPTPAR